MTKKKIFIGAAVILVIAIGLVVWKLANNDTNNIIDKPLCMENEKIIYRFETEDNKSACICTDKNDKYIVFRFGKDKEIEYEYPKKLDESSWGKFAYLKYSAQEYVTSECPTNRISALIFDNQHSLVLVDLYSAEAEGLIKEDYEPEGKIISYKYLTSDTDEVYKEYKCNEDKPVVGDLTDIENYKDKLTGELTERIKFFNMLASGNQLDPDYPDYSSLSDFANTNIKRNNDYDKYLCKDNEEVIYSMNTESEGKTVSICVEKDNDEYIVVRVANKDKILMEYPKDLDSSSWRYFSYYSKNIDELNYTDNIFSFSAGERKVFDEELGIYVMNTIPKFLFQKTEEDNQSVQYFKISSNPSSIGKCMFPKSEYGDITLLKKYEVKFE